METAGLALPGEVAHRRGRPWRWLRGTGSVVAGALLIAFVLPSISGMSWTELRPVLGQVTAAQLLLLTALWFVGLLTHTIALTAALPHLTHRRALTLSLTGSAVSNVTPLGGAVGVGLNFHMTRAWGASNAQFAVFTFVTNLWDVLAKLVVPAAIVAVLLATNAAPVGVSVGSAVTALGGLLAAMAVTGALLVSERAADATSRCVARSLNAVLGLIRSHRVVDPSALLELRSASWETLRAKWQQLTVGQLAYTALLFALLWLSMRVTGSGLTTAQLLAGLAVERLLSLSVLTPGGTGVIEVGLVGFLIAAGGSPAGTVAGVLLYRAYTFLIEIPVGGALLAGWFWVRRSRWSPESPAGLSAEAVALGSDAGARNLVAAGIREPP